MPQTPAVTQRVLALFAHPDDEISVGGTLARAAAEGAAVTLVCATRGEAATIYSPPEYGATAENLAHVRTGELECSCAALGIQDLRWLDWPDGRVAEIDRDAAVGEVVALLRAVQPQIVITHPADGGYGHPDHIAIHEIALAAWQLAADADYRPELGPAWAASKLYSRAMPLSLFASVPSLAEFRIDLNGRQLPFHATPDEEISTALDVAAWLEQRMAGWDCHRSQHNPHTMWSGVSEEARRALASREYLQVIAYRLPVDVQHEKDLWAGLEPTGPGQDLAGGAAEDDEPGESVDAASQAAADQLLAALRSRRTYLLIYQDYLKRSPKPDFAALLHTLVEHAQDAIAILSGALRRIDRSPMRAGINEKLLAQGTGRRVAAGKLNFIIVGSARNLEWYGQQLAQDSPPAIQAVWQALIDLETQDQQAAKGLLAAVEQATSHTAGQMRV